MVKTLIPAALMFALLAGCGSDPVQQAYDDCMSQVSQAKTETSNEAMNKMMEGMQGMAESACGMILTTCENDPESALCQGMISKYVESE